MRIVLCNAAGEVKENLSIDEFLDESRKMRSKDEFFWADVESPTPEEMQRIADESGIHHLTAEDCLNRQAPVKLEETDNYLFIVTHVLNFNEGGDPLETLNLSLIVFPNSCLTIHTSPVRSVDIAMKRFKRHAAKIFSGPERVVYLVLQALTGFYAELMEGATDEVDAIEDAVIDGEADALILQRISRVGRQISVVRRRLIPTGRMLERLCSDEVERIDTDTHIYLRDALDGVVRLLEKSQVVREVLNITQSNYLTHISNETNAVMKTLSLVATVVLPLSFLTGLFGMNVRVPGQEGEGLIWFICLLGLMAVFAGFLLFLFRRKDWF